MSKLSKLVRHPGLFFRDAFRNRKRDLLHRLDVVEADAARHAVAFALLQWLARAWALLRGLPPESRRLSANMARNGFLRQAFGPVQPGVSGEDENGRAELSREDIERRLRKTLDAHLASFKARDRYFDKDRALRCLAELTEAFRARGVRLFLNSGTLLGAMREGDIVSSDYDIDLAVLESEIDRDGALEIIGALDHYSFLEDRSFPNELVFTSADDIQVEIFIAREVEGKIILESDVHSWIHSRCDLVPMRMRECEIFVPELARKWLVENYCRWREPFIHYVTTFDTPNRVYRNTPIALAYLAQYAALAIRNGQRRTALLALAALREHFDLEPDFPQPRRAAPLPGEQRGRGDERDDLPLVLGTFERITPPLLLALEEAACPFSGVRLALFARDGNKASAAARAEVLAAVHFVREVRIVHDADELEHYLTDHPARDVVLEDAALECLPGVGKNRRRLDLAQTWLLPDNGRENPCSNG